MNVETRDLGVSRGGRALLEGVSIRVAAGQRVALIGPNGAGKSTLLRAIAGVEVRPRGAVFFDGVDAAQLGPRDRARLVSLMLPDLPSTFGYTALERVLQGRTPHLGRFGIPSSTDVTLAIECLGRVEAAELAGRTLSSLSSGERQRVVFAAALAQQAGVVLLDEPASALDLRGTALVLREIERLAGQGHVVVAAMHDLNAVIGRFDRAVLLEGGRVVADGDVAEVVESAHAARAWNEGFEVVRSDAGPLVIPRRGALRSG